MIRAPASIVDGRVHQRRAFGFRQPRKRERARQSIGETVMHVEGQRAGELRQTPHRSEDRPRHERDECAHQRRRARREAENRATTWPA